MPYCRRRGCGNSRRRVRTRIYRSWATRPGGRRTATQRNDAGRSSSWGSEAVATATRRMTAELGYVLPLLVLMLAAFVLPIVLMLARSVLQPEPTLEHYQALLETTVYLRVLGRTFRIALVTTIACALLGYPLA